MQTPSVSIIMPVYNAESFLKRSIDSVLRQTYTMWELIIVDDGSEDCSRQIVRTYCAMDSRIKLLCNEHGGTARARNSAIAVAEGDYFAFIDADDIYHPQYLELLVSAAIESCSDLSICKISCGIEFSEFLESSPSSTYNVISVNQAFSKMYNGEWELMISPWNKLYSRTLFEVVRFPDGKRFEDLATVNLVTYASNHICLLDSPLYFYYTTPNSSSKTKRSEELLDREWGLRSHWEYFLREKQPQLAYLALSFYILELIIIHYRIKESDCPEDCQIIRTRFEKTYKKYRRKLSFSKEQTDRIFAFRHPHLYDIRNMIRKDGVRGTLAGFIKRKIIKHE